MEEGQVVSLPPLQLDNYSFQTPIQRFSSEAEPLVGRRHFIPPTLSLEPSEDERERAAGEMGQPQEPTVGTQSVAANVTGRWAQPSAGGAPVSRNGTHGRYSEADAVAEMYREKTDRLLGLNTRAPIISPLSRPLQGEAKRMADEETPVIKAEAMKVYRALKWIPDLSRYVHRTVPMHSPKARQCISLIGEALWCTTKEFEATEGPYLELKPPGHGLNEVVDEVVFNLALEKIIESVFQGFQEREMLAQQDLEVGGEVQRSHMHHTMATSLQVEQVAWEGPTF